MHLYTIISTFILGFTLGMFGLFALVLFFIHLDDKSTALKKAAHEYATRYGCTPEMALELIKNRN